MAAGAMAKAGRVAWFALPFLLACMVVFLLERGAEYVISPEGQSQSDLAEPFFNLSGLYQRLVTAGPRKPVQKFTVLIDDNPSHDAYYAQLSGGVLELCQRRAALATLLWKIASADPAVIVLDKAFRRKQCPAADPGTQALQAAIATLSTRIPFVVGRRIDRSDWSMYPSLEFPHDGAHLLQEGVIEFDPDTKRLPLRWATRLRNTASTAWEWSETLSLRAAEAYDERLQDKYPRLKDLLRGPTAMPGEATHPYVSFLNVGQLSVYTPGEILCGSSAARCQQRPAALRNLRAKIVLVGENSEDDLHLSVIGEVPGFVLHANYIEALLDQRYFNPAPWLDYVLGFAIFSLIMLGLDFEKFTATLVWWALSLGIAYLLVYFIIMHMGYYVNPVAVSMLALLFNFTHLLFSRLKQASRLLLERLRVLFKGEKS